jgi:hypothetical protein
MNINSGGARLVLLCPGWKKWGAVKTVKPGTVVLHSRADDIVPFSDSEELVRNSGLPKYTLMEAGNDHWLNDAGSLRLMLEACSDDHAQVVADKEDLLGQDWTGLCYTAALRWVRKAEDQDWTVVHGTVLSERAGNRIEHAWCERGNLVVDLAMPVGARIIERERYYRVVQPEVRKSYSSDDVILLAIKNRHDGPWDETEQLKE